MLPPITPKGHNLSVYLLMPFLGINVGTFGDEFVNTYISYNGKIIVKLRNSTDVNFIDSPFYLTDFTQVEETDDVPYLYIVYKVPPAYEEEFTKFLEGKYSEYSIAGKSFISKNCGLDYNLNVNGKIETDGLLLILHKHHGFKEYLEKELGTPIDSKVELWPKPDLNKEVLDIDTDLCFE